MKDVVVVGGGPAGTRTAALLAKDCDVTLIEEHPTFGHPAQCTGLLSERTVSLTGVRPTILNKLTGARFHLPSGDVIEVHSDEVKGVLIDRTELDGLMAERAMDMGAELMTSVKYIGHEVLDGNVRMMTDKGEYMSKVIVGADGHSSSVATSIGNNGPKEYVRGLQYDVRKRSDGMDTIDIFVGSKVAPGFFAWSIPFDDRMRIGLCCSWDRGLPTEHMRHLLRLTGAYDCEIVRKYSGKIPLGGRRRTYSDNLILVGDAAGQVKAASGGGLYPNLKASVHAADTIRNALDAGDLSSRMMSSYERAWRSDIGKELRDSYRIRKILLKMGDDDFNRMYRPFSDPKVVDIISTVDIDDPSVAVKGMMRHPGVLIKMLPSLLRAMI